MRALLLVALAATATLLAGCGGAKHRVSTGAGKKDAAGCVHVAAPPAKARTRSKPKAALDPAKTYTVTLQTNCGSFSIGLAVETSPHATASFVSLVRSKFFDGTIFHRIAVGFVIQGGDPTASGTGGPGYLTVDRPPASTSYTLGVAAMAKTQEQAPGTAGSQFFVVTAKNAELPPDYAVLGKVTSGLQVVERIGKLGDAHELPTEVVQIEHATVSVG